MRKRITSIIMAITMVFTAAPSSMLVVRAEEVPKKTQLSDPHKSESGEDVIYDHIYFGKYPQIEIVDHKESSGLCYFEWKDNDDFEVNKELYDELKSSKDWKDNEIEIKGEKYIRIPSKDLEKVVCFTYVNPYHYFRYDPIKWRVLHAYGDKALLLADEILDNVSYDTDETANWDTSHIRNWLNQDFLDRAFSEEEQKSIFPVGKKKADYVTLLDDDFVIGRFGFNDDEEEKDQARSTKGTPYAIARGLYVDEEAFYEDEEKEDYFGKSSWWLKNPWEDQVRASVISSSGRYLQQATRVNEAQGVRPLISIYYKGSKANIDF